MDVATAKKIGRPRKTAPLDTEAHVLQWSRDGLSKEVIARRLGTSPKTFNRWIEERPQLGDAFELGRARLLTHLTSKLMEHVESADSAISLKAVELAHDLYFGIRRGAVAIDLGNRVNITFNIPGASTPEEYERKHADVVDVGADTDVAVSTRRFRRS